MRAFHVAVLSGVALVLVPAAAVSQIRAELRTCAELHAQRNAIFRNAGYCLRTPRGNAGCAYDSRADVPLSHRDRERIAEIRRTERARGCVR